MFTEGDREFFEEVGTRVKGCGGREVCAGCGVIHIFLSRGLRNLRNPRKLRKQNSVSCHTIITMSNPKLLIADDSDAKQLMLEGFVRHNHWKVEVLTAASTVEAKKLIDKNPDIAFAFVDYEMPTEDGPAVIRYLKEKNPNARIALVSSSDSDKYQNDATAAGAEKCLCTSYQSDIVERAMVELISEWRGNGELRMQN